LKRASVRLDAHSDSRVTGQATRLFREKRGHRACNVPSRAKRDKLTAHNRVNRRLYTLGLVPSARCSVDEGGNGQGGRDSSLRFRRKGRPFLPTSSRLRPRRESLKEAIATNDGLLLKTSFARMDQIGEGHLTGGVALGMRSIFYQERGHLWSDNCCSK